MHTGFDKVLVFSLTKKPALTQYLYKPKTLIHSNPKPLNTKPKPSALILNPQIMDPEP